MKDAYHSAVSTGSSLLGHLRRGRMNELLQNITASYGFYFSGFLLSFLLIPYLARVLGPARWGIFALAQALGYYLLLIEEYGFAFSGTRAVARHRDNPAALSEILAGVTGAKCILALVVITVGITAFAFLPPLWSDQRLFWWGVVWAVLQGGNLNWYYQGLERMRVAASVDILIKTVSTLVTFAVVRAPEDAWKVLALAAIACLISLGTLTYLAYRNVPFSAPTPALVFTNLKSGLGMFFPRNSYVLSSMSGVFIISIFAPAAVVGQYAGAERVCRAMIGLLIPLTDALYSRLNRIRALSPGSFHRSARLVLGAMTALGVLIGASIFVCAPYIIKVILGRNFQSAVVLLRILALITPFIALGNTIGAHWMLPLGLDRPFSWLSLAALFTTVALTSVLTPRFGSVGAAYSLVVSQILLTIAAYTILRLRIRKNRRDDMNALRSADCNLETASGA